MTSTVCGQFLELHCESLSTECSNSSRAHRMIALHRDKINEPKQLGVSMRLTFVIARMSCNKNKFD